MTDINHIELMVWSDEIYERLVIKYKQMREAGIENEAATQALQPLIDFCEALDKELETYGQ